MKKRLTLAGMVFWLLCLAIFAGEPEPGRQIRIASYNIRHGRGTDGQVDLKRTIDVLARFNADLIALQEVDRNCARSGKQDIAAILGKRLGMEMRFAKLLDFEGGQYGLAVLSKYPIRKFRRIVLPRGEREPRCALEVVVQPKGSLSPISLVCLHLDWLDEDARVMQMKALLEALEKTTHPVILAGDFNSRRSGRSMKILQESGWHILHKKDAKNQKTYPSIKPTAEIDFIVIRGFKDAKTECAVVVEKMASDHRPITATITLSK